MTHFNFCRKKTLKVLQDDLKKYWPAVKVALNNAEIKPLEVSWKKTGTQIKYRIWLQDIEGKRVFLSGTHESEHGARNSASLGERIIVDPVLYLQRAMK